MIPPLTPSECDKQLEEIHRQYLLAERRLDFDAAFNLWTKLQRFLDMRLRMPLPRVSPETGGVSCTDSPSTGSAA